MPVSADQSDPVRDFAEQIVERQMREANAADVQEWIDSALTDQAGVGAEWTILALSRYGGYDFTAYRSALLGYLAQNEVYAPSTRLKYALTLLAVGSDDPYIGQTLDNSIGQQGIMSLVFGLHLMNNGVKCSHTGTDEVIGQLLALQLSDGGWALSGSVSDVDVTAMTLQALAPHHADDPAVKDAVDRALVLLSERQFDEGDYASYGVRNPESGAQVIIALSSLGIDCMTDSRFIKNGHTLFDGLSRYRLSDGSFCHTEGGTPAASATEQVLCAAVAYLRMAEGLGAFYLLDGSVLLSPDLPQIGDLPDEPPATSSSAPATSALSTPVTTAPETEPTEASDSTASVDHPLGGYKLWAVLAVIALGGAGCLLLFLLKKRTLKHFLPVLAAMALAIAFVTLTDLRSADDYYSGETVPKDDAVGKVTLTIRCDTLVGKAESEYIPKDGIILDLTEFEIEEGDTVYDILLEAARAHKIQLENDGSGEMPYITGIGYLYALDYGALSGWVYTVNGEIPSLSCSEYTLSDGDVIEWHYTCESGNDVR